MDEIEIEGIKVLISQRPNENIYDVKFINAPTEFPPGYTIGFTSSSSAPSLEMLLEDVKETISSYRDELL